jgi:uncharacterized protein (TIGR02246 family)
MKMRSLHTLAALAISFVLPTFAQDTVDPQVAQQICALVAKYDEVFSRRDPAAVAALFTEDAVRVTPRGTFTGRAAIEKSFADGDYQFYHTSDLFINVDRAIADGNEVRSIGKWSSDIKEPGRLREHVGGRYSMLWVHDSDTWKIHENTCYDSEPD